MKSATTRCLAAAALNLALTWSANAQIAGEYSGQYVCQTGPIKFDLQISEAGGRLSATFTFYPAGIPPGSYRLRGSYQAATGAFSLEPAGWIQQPRGYIEVGLAGTFDARVRRLSGKIVHPLCSTFAAAARTAASGATTAGEKIAPAVVAAGPEGSRTGMDVTNVRDFEYVDVTMLGATATAEISPLEEMFKWLEDQKFRCLSTRPVVWIGNQGTATDRFWGTKRYLIECRKNCAGLQYRQVGVYAGFWATRYHFGLSQPYPLLQVRSLAPGYTDFKWEFTGPGQPLSAAEARRRPPTSGQPEIYIHTWTNAAADEGAGCRLFEDGGVDQASPDLIDRVRTACLASPVQRGGKPNDPKYCQCVISAMTGARLPRAEFIYYGMQPMFSRDALASLAIANPEFGQRYSRCVQ
jgi:hypothetical protein